MDTAEIIKKVRKIEIKTKSLSTQIFQGEYQSAFKGRGMLFSEVRSYSYGDDVRNIDWNVTARTNDPYIKVFEEERELTVMLLVDVSDTLNIGTQTQLKKEFAIEIVATIAFSAAGNNDKVGIILYGKGDLVYIPPKKSKKHILLLIRTLLDFNPTNGHSNVNDALKYLLNVQKKKCITFIVSDFMDQNYLTTLSVAVKRHEILGIRVLDLLDTELPNVGLVRFNDLKNGEQLLINTSDQKIRKKYQDHFLQSQKYYEDTFKKCGSKAIKILTTESYVTALHGVFKKKLA